MDILKLQYASNSNYYVIVTTDSSEYISIETNDDVKDAILNGISISDSTEILELKNKLIELISNERDLKYDKGFYVASVNKWFHSTQFSRGQQLGLVQLGSSLPVGVQWKTMDGTFVTMTQELANEILISASLSDMEIFNISEIKKQEVMDCKNIDELLNYNYSDGWPKRFNE